MVSDTRMRPEAGLLPLGYSIRDAVFTVSPQMSLGIERIKSH